jgi:hypothetical protein
MEDINCKYKFSYRNIESELFAHFRFAEISNQRTNAKGEQRRGQTLHHATWTERGGKNGGKLQINYRDEIHRENAKREKCETKNSFLVPHMKRTKCGMVFGRPVRCAQRTRVSNIQRKQLVIDRKEIGKVLLHALHAVVRVRLGNLLEKRLGQGVGEVWRRDAP